MIAMIPGLVSVTIEDYIEGFKKEPLEYIIRELRAINTPESHILLDHGDITYIVFSTGTICRTDRVLAKDANYLEDDQLRAIILSIINHGNKN
jgi:hypothetical protein